MGLQKEEHFSKKEKVIGQFLTPPEVAEFIVDFASIFVENKERGVDPACGDGVFLSALLRSGFREVWGMDIDKSVFNLMPENVKKNAKILIGDALAMHSLIPQNTALPNNYFDLAVGNPPFSAKYGRVHDNRLEQYELGKGRKSQAVEVLFLERFIKLVKPGGIIGVILPDGIFINENYYYVRKFILRYKVLGIISLPRGIFRGKLRTTSKTSILFLKKIKNDDEDVFMYEANSLRDLREVIKAYREKGRLWVRVSADSLHPKSYKKVEIKFNYPYPVKRLEDLVLDIHAGGTEYGPKRRFSDKGLRYISAKVVTPMGLDFKKDEKFIEQGGPMDKKQGHVEVNDIVFVRVGVGCSGRTAVIIDEDDLGVADDWIYIIKVDASKVLPHYLAMFLQTVGRSQIESLKRGVGTVTIPIAELKKVKILIPPLEFQEYVKSEYIKMVKLLRKGMKKEAEKIFNEIKKKIEELNNHNV
jgi:type I restriction enzyme M protein